MNNRELKFRAFINNKFYRQEYCGGFSYFIYNESDALSLEHVFVLSEKGECIIQQYTGLKDKNGKSIYEGDILKWHLGENNLSEVIFQNGSFMVKGINWGAYWYLSDYINSYTVIGNIFENPELIKKDE